MYHLRKPYNGFKVTETVLLKLHLHEFHGDQFESLLFESFDDIRNKTSVNGIWFEHEECSLLVFLVILSHSRNLFFDNTVHEHATDNFAEFLEAENVTPRGLGL